MTQRNLLEVVRDKIDEVYHRGRMYASTKDGAVSIRMREINNDNYTCVENLSIHPENQLFGVFLDLFHFLERNAQAPIAFYNVRSRSIEQHLLNNGYNRLKINNDVVLLEHNYSPVTDFYKDVPCLQLV